MSSIFTPNWISVYPGIAKSYNGVLSVFIGNFCYRFYFVKIRNFFPVLRKVFLYDVQMRHNQGMSLKMRRRARPRDQSAHNCPQLWSLVEGCLRCQSAHNCPQLWSLVEGSPNAEVAQWEKLNLYIFYCIICYFVNFFCWVIKEELLFLLFIINRCNDSCWGAEEVLQSSADP